MLPVTYKRRGERNSQLMCRLYDFAPGKVADGLRPTVESRGFIHNTSVDATTCQSLLPDIYLKKNYLILIYCYVRSLSIANVLMIIKDDKVVREKKNKFNVK